MHNHRRRLESHPISTQKKKIAVALKKQFIIGKMQQGPLTLVACLQKKNVKMNGQNQHFDIVIEKFPALNKTSVEWL